MSEFEYTVKCNLIDTPKHAITHTHKWKIIFARKSEGYHCTQRVTYMEQEMMILSNHVVFLEKLCYFIFWFRLIQLGCPTPPPFIKVYVPSQESERSCILSMYVRGINCVSVCTILY